MWWVLFPRGLYHTGVPISASLILSFRPADLAAAASHLLILLATYSSVRAVFKGENECDSRNNR